MKSVRKSIALLLALVMVLALSTAAFAAPVTYLDGARLGYTVPSRATLNQNIGAGSITKNVGETGIYQRLPRLTTTCNYCGGVLTEDIPETYQVSPSVGYTLSDPSILKDCEFTLAYASNFAGYEKWPCLEFDYTAAKPGTTTVTLTFYYNFHANFTDGYCDGCGRYVQVPSNYNWYYDVITFTVHVTGEEETDYALTYDTNGGKEANWTETQSTTAGYATFTVSSTVPTRDGYTFLGWSTSSSGRVRYEDGASVKNLTATQGKTVTLYALWRAYSYEIHFDDGQEAQGTMKPMLRLSRARNYTLTANRFKYPGHSFLGWSTDPAATVPTWKNRARIRDLASYVGESIVLYAVWK